ncbi:MAG: hypothetical protein ABSF70_04075 [Terracidiphilus sp.]|jgi:sensor histidine kinase YesM
MGMILHFLRNCFWLIVPVMLMNVLLMGKLPKMYQSEVFSRSIPVWVVAGENIFRLGIFVLPLLMQLQITRPGQKTGIVLYLAGLILYFSSWAMQIWFPNNQWSASRWGFMAPSYTPLVWLIGIALVGDSLYVPIYYSPWIYIGLSAVFLIFHNLHTWIVYTRAHAEC